MTYAELNIRVNQLMKQFQTEKDAREEAEAKAKSKSKK
jgi:hypothetical protein